MKSISLKRITGALAAALICLMVAVSAASLLTVGAGAAKSIELGESDRLLPVIMYHQILKSGKSKYIISPDTFERDLIELKRRGYTAVLPSEIISFCESGGSLPEKPILITFDDGHYNNYFYCAPLLKKYNMKALANIIGCHSEYSTSSGDHSNVNYSHLTWQQIREMNESGIFEIGNHTYNMHKMSPRRGIELVRGESKDAYKSALLEDVSRLEEKFESECGFRSECFAYPFGILNTTAEETLWNAGYKMLLNCYERTNVITQNNPVTLKKICRFNRDSNYSSMQFFNKLER